MASERPLPAWLRSPKLHVRVPSRPGVVLVVATSRVSHVPAGADGAGLTLCQHYDGASSAAMARAAAAGASLCPDGAACGFVHADVRGATEYTPHVRAEAAAYARHPPGTSIRAARPNHSAATLTVDSGELLATRALASHRQMLSLCAHFSAKGRCDRGPQCFFLHHVGPKQEISAAAATRPRALSMEDAASAGAESDARSHASILTPMTAAAPRRVPTAPRLLPPQEIAPCAACEAIASTPFIDELPTNACCRKRGSGLDAHARRDSPMSDLGRPLGTPATVGFALPEAGPAERHVSRWRRDGRRSHNPYAAAPLLATEKAS